MFSSCKELYPITKTAEGYTFEIDENQNATLIKTDILAETIEIPSEISSYKVKKLSCVEEAALVGVSLTGVFEGNNVVKEIIIPEGVVETYGPAIANCYNLEKITIPGTMTTFDVVRCYNLKEVNIVDGDTITSLRTGSSYNSVIALVVIVHHVAFLYLLTILLYYVILQVVKFGVLILVDNLLIRKCSLCLRIPVDHTYATINQSLVIKVAEYVDDGTGTSLVHGERSAVPVAASTEAAQLLEDDATMLVGPVPSMLQEFLTSEVSLLDALLSEAIYHLSLSCDAGVVCARNPTSVLVLHASATNEDVLDCIVEHVTHVEHTSHIRWRNNHRIRFTTIWLRTEKFVV